jgi:hypothetical protein
MTAEARTNGDGIADLPVLQRLSGLKQSAAIKRWLAQNGVPFMVQPSGQPVTTVDAITKSILGGRRPGIPGVTEPDFSKRWVPMPRHLRWKARRT